jgi:hypothetical protein
MKPGLEEPRCLVFYSYGRTPRKKRLMSTGLTFGTISSLYGLNAGIIDRQQFTILIGAVVGSAIVPTIIAQRWFAPPVHVLTAEEIAQVEDEEFEPPRRFRGATSDTGRAR